MKKKVLILDMDGTIADTYNYPDWAGILRGHPKDPWTQCGKVDPREVSELFRNVNPMVNPDELEKFCKSWDDTVVYSMAPWDATSQVEIATVAGKVIWLKELFPFIKNIVITRYHHDKSDIRDVLYKDFKTLSDNWQPSRQDTLIDDNEELRKNFKGDSMVPPWINIIL